jgi:hypothetical protein
VGKFDHPALVQQNGSLLGGQGRTPAWGRSPQTPMLQNLVFATLVGKDAGGVGLNHLTRLRAGNHQIVAGWTLGSNQVLQLKVMALGATTTIGTANLNDYIGIHTLSTKHFCIN